MSIEIKDVQAEGALIIVDGNVTGTHYAVFPLLAEVLENLANLTPVMTINAETTKGDINFIQQITGDYTLLPVEFDVYDVDASIEGDAMCVLVGKYEGQTAVAFGDLDAVKGSDGDLKTMSMFLSDEDLEALPAILRGVEFPAE